MDFTKADYEKTLEVSEEPIEESLEYTTLYTDDFSTIIATDCASRLVKKSYITQLLLESLHGYNILVYDKNTDKITNFGDFIGVSFCDFSCLQTRLNRIMIGTLSIMFGGAKSALERIKLLESDLTYANFIHRYFEKVNSLDTEIDKNIIDTLT